MLDTFRKNWKAGDYDKRVLVICLGYDLLCLPFMVYDSPPYDRFDFILVNMITVSLILSLGLSLYCSLMVVTWGRYRYKYYVDIQKYPKVELLIWLSANRIPYRPDQWESTKPTSPTMALIRTLNHPHTGKYLVTVAREEHLLLLMMKF